MVLFYIALGGALGALARYGLAGWVQDRLGLAFPWGTLAVNVLGCLLMGLALRYFEALRPTPELRALVGVGLLGAFTTFSTFSFEAVALLENGAWGRAAAYVLASVVVGIAAVYGGMAISGILLVRGQVS
ncbi:MAG TPA: fluoride efflux transporter CrcB [Longimicrobiales bacterium]|nr:fluoride efflux transporter CrcB [Longimicrobiales bacterium]